MCDECRALRERIRRLETFVSLSEMPLRLYAARNPKWKPTHGDEQDPAGVHELLSSLDQLLPYDPEKRCRPLSDPSSRVSELGSDLVRINTLLSRALVWLADEPEAAGLTGEIRDALSSPLWGREPELRAAAQALLDALPTCVCDNMYTDRGLVSPDCQAHEFEDEAARLRELLGQVSYRTQESTDEENVDGLC